VGFRTALVRQFSIVLGVSLSLLAVLVFMLGGALAAPPELFVDESVNALLHGDSGDFHYHIEFFAGQTFNEDVPVGESPIPNAAVEVAVFDSTSHAVVIEPCFGGEKQLEAPAALDIANGLKTASFDGVYAESGCFWGDADFDLYWTARGRLLIENSHSGEPGEICHESSKERSAVAAGTVEFSSGPSTLQFTVESDSASISIENQTRCLMPGPPQPD